MGIMRQLSNDEKAQIYNQMLFQYQRLQEQVRLIRADSIDLNIQQLQEIKRLEAEMKRIFNETQKLY